MDQLIRALAHQGKIRIFVATTTQLVEEARQKHNTYPTASAALGRLLSVGVCMGSMLKSKDEKVSLIIRGDGPLKTLMVDANNQGIVRGFAANPQVHLISPITQKLDVAAAIGAGKLQIIKDMNMKTNYTSTIDLQSGEIGEDFAYYFTVSEQTPSAVSVGVMVDTDSSILAAGAIIIQMMPDADSIDIEIAEHVVKHLKPVSQMIAEGMQAKDIASVLFDDVEILSAIPVKFECSCSKNRMRQALLTIEAKDLKEMINEDHGCELTCHFCNTVYEFTEEECIDIFREKVNYVAYS